MSDILRKVQKPYPYRRLGIIIELILGALLIAAFAFYVGYRSVDHIGPSINEDVEANDLALNHDEGNFDCEDDFTGNCWRCRRNGDVDWAYVSGIECDWDELDAKDQP